MPKVAIIESHRTKAELLCHYLADRRGFEVVVLECTAASGVQAVERCQPDVVLASLAMPDLYATEIIARLRFAATATKIIGLVSRCSEYLVHSLANTGYHGLYCDADEGLAGLIRTIEQVLQGKRAVSAPIVKYQIALATATASFPKLLSKREQETLVCIAHAMTDEEIGRHMAVSSWTAQSHRKRIMGKLGIHSTPKLIGYCVQKGFQIAPPPATGSRNDAMVFAPPNRMKPAEATSY
jgi:two-component system, NarL family, response regulator NreC